MKKISNLLISLIIILLLCNTVMAEDKTHFSFRGISIGIPLKDQIPECKDDWYAKADPCYSKDMFELNHYEVNLLPGIGFNTVTYIDTIDGNIERITTFLSDESAEKMLHLLKEKYGKPKIYNTSVVQNRMSAKYESFIASWIIKKCDLTLMNRVSKVDDGYLVIESVKWQKQQKEEQKKKEKQALDVL